MKVQLNINNLTTVKLTDHGLAILQREAPYALTTSWFKEETSEYTSELWNIMRIFGNDLYMGSPNLFKDCEIVVDNES